MDPLCDVTCKAIVQHSVNIDDSKGWAMFWLQDFCGENRNFTDALNVCIGNQLLFVECCLRGFETNDPILAQHAKEALMRVDNLLE